MEQYDIATARATLPAILRLGPRIAPYSVPLREFDPAGENLKWRDLARERGVRLPENQIVGNQVRVLRKRIVPGLNAFATLSMLGESAFIMADTPYGQQLGAGHMFFPQVIANHVEVAMNANYRLFTSGYAEVKLKVGTIPDAEIREYIAYAWGRLALDQIVAELPDGDAELGRFQIGPRQVSAVAEYVEDLRSTPRQS